MLGGGSVCSQDDLARFMVALFVIESFENYKGKKIELVTKVS